MPRVLTPAVITLTNQPTNQPTRTTLRPCFSAIQITDEDEAGATNLLAQSDSTEHVGTVGDDNVLSTANPLHALGECVIETSLAANSLRAPEPPPAVPKFSMRLCMCGKTLTGKSEQAIRLADRYCLKVRVARVASMLSQSNQYCLEEASICLQVAL